MTTRISATRSLRWVLMALLLGLIALPAAGAPKGRDTLGSRTFLRMSQSVGIRYYLQHPDQAPGRLAERLSAASRLVATGRTGSSRGPANVLGDVFNGDDLGLPQNEESVTACRSDTDIVLEGTNDYRGLLDPDGNFTGWHFSKDGGRSLANEGLLPPVEMKGQQIESGGDPIVVADDDCNLYAADLNYDVVPDGDFLPNGVGVYKTDAETLAKCPGGTDPSCWPVRKAAAVAKADNVFLDKPWIYVGESGGETVVWVVYAEFTFPPDDFFGLPFTNLIKAVRCDADLVSCTKPITISRPQNPSIQFGDVTIGPDGRTYITWEEDNDLKNNFEPPENMKFYLRVAPPGSTNFGPPRLVAREPLNLGFAILHANDFRIATYPKNEVAMVKGRPRVFLTWEGCAARPLDVVCEEPEIKLRFSDDLGETWSETKVLSAGGDNYFPSISYDRARSKLAVTWFTNRYDPIFHNRQDVELATVDTSGNVVKRQRLTPESNESEADPILGGSFIGDYIEVFAHNGRAWVGYNANYRSVQLLGEGFPIPQQDNYLERARF